MTSAPPSKPNHLEPSQLGTKEYWDNLYVNELSNHALNPTDEGTIWFDDSAAEDKILSFLQKKIAEEHILGTGISKSNCSFLDLGTGNGHFLFALREGEEDDEDEDGEEEGEREGNKWAGRMLGVDYSERSIEFAKRIAGDKGFGDGSDREVEFRKWDIMTEDPSGVVLSGENEKGWDVVLDKGTFDAISLSEEKDAQGRRICEGYKERVVPLVREGGILLVTSCNWTEEELEKWFAGGDLEVLGRIEYKSFSFGGKKGQTISSCSGAGGFTYRARSDIWRLNVQGATLLDLYCLPKLKSTNTCPSESEKRNCSSSNLSICFNLRSRASTNLFLNLGSSSLDFMQTAALCFSTVHLICPNLLETTTKHLLCRA